MATLSLLIVDDEPGIRSGIRRILTDFYVDLPFLEEEFNFNIFDAESGEEAIEIIEKIAIDIVLLDNKLPGMDGIEVLEYINKKQNDKRPYEYFKKVFLYHMIPDVFYHKMLVYKKNQYKNTKRYRKKNNLFG